MDAIPYILWALVAIGSYSGLVLVTLVLFACVMALQLARDKSKLTPDLRSFSLLVLGIGYLCDFLVNIVGCLFVLFVLPRDLLLTMTLSRIKREWNARLAAATTTGTVLVMPWRVKVALWVCGNLLDPLETHPSGCHCRY